MGTAAGSTDLPAAVATIHWASKGLITSLLMVLVHLVHSNAVKAGLLRTPELPSFPLNAVRLTINAWPGNGNIEQHKAGLTQKHVTYVMQQDPRGPQTVRARFSWR
jgi:hypothetical protein